ncbi:MAG: hypothetical protein SWE60_23025 [Thermodesulfobacteriota bacterium]|nr:hypothetical protein [Thermodesulfobacteriota bacterium]
MEPGPKRIAAFIPSVVLARKRPLFGSTQPFSREEIATPILGLWLIIERKRK